MQFGLGIGMIYEMGFKSVDTVASRVGAYVHPEVVETVVCRDEVGACAVAARGCVPCAWGLVGRIAGSRFRVMAAWVCVGPRWPGSFFRGHKSKEQMVLWT